MAFEGRGSGPLKRKWEDGIENVNPQDMGMATPVSKKNKKAKDGGKGGPADSPIANPASTGPTVKAQKPLSKKALKKAAKKEAKAAKARAENATPLGEKKQAGNLASPSVKSSNSKASITSVTSKKKNNPTQNGAPGQVPNVVDFFNLYRWLFKAQPGQIYKVDPSGKGSGFKCAQGSPRTFLSPAAYVIVLESVPCVAKIADIARLVQPYKLKRALFPAIPKGGGVRRVVVCADLPSKDARFVRLSDTHFGGMNIKVFSLGHNGKLEFIPNPLPAIFQRLEKTLLESVHQLGHGNWYMKRLRSAASKGTALIWEIGPTNFKVPFEQVCADNKLSQDAKTFWNEVLALMVFHLVRHARKEALHVNAAESDDGAWLSCLYESQDAARAAHDTLRKTPLFVGKHQASVFLAYKTPTQLASMLQSKRSRGLLCADATEHPDMGSVLMEGLMDKLYRDSMPQIPNFSFTPAEKEACRMLQSPDFLSNSLREKVWKTVIPKFKLTPTDKAAKSSPNQPSEPGEVNSNGTEEDRNETISIDFDEGLGNQSSAEGEATHTVLPSQDKSPNTNSKLNNVKSSSGGDSVEVNREAAQAIVILSDMSNPELAHEPSADQVENGDTFEQPKPTGFSSLAASTTNGECDANTVISISSSPTLSPELYVRQLDFIKGRYWTLFPDTPRCGICFASSHDSADCQSRSCSHCLLVDAHLTSACPSLTRCPRCLELGGSKTSPCVCHTSISTKPKTCRRCKARDVNHTESTCPSLWRRTPYRSSETESASTTKMLVFCYACGAKNHFGANCPSVPRSLSLQKGGSCDTFSQAYAQLFQQSSLQDPPPLAASSSPIMLLDDDEDVSRSSSHKHRRDRGVHSESAVTETRRRFLDDTDSSDIEEYTRQIFQIGEYSGNRHWDDKNVDEVEDDPFANLGRVNRKRARGADVPLASQSNTDVLSTRPTEPESIVPGLKTAQSQPNTPVSAVASKKTISINLESVHKGESFGGVHGAQGGGSGLNTPSSSKVPSSASSAYGNPITENTFVPPPISEIIPFPARPPPVAAGARTSSTNGPMAPRRMHFGHASGGGGGGHGGHGGSGNAGYGMGARGGGRFGPPGLSSGRGNRPFSFSGRGRY